MEKMREMEEQAIKYAGSMDTEGQEKFRVAVEWLKEHNSPALKERMVARINESLDKVEEEIKELNIRAQLADTYELLPISYIAKEYFGKTAAWLYQRLNGYKVRGKVYSLSEDEKATFNKAIQDIAHRIGSVCID